MPAPANLETAAARSETGLAERLRRGRALIASLPFAPDASARALDRLDRDLLPRAADGTPYVVAGIVGPNNAGKSALFNALVGSRLSPSIPTGGATRRLVGAAHPDLLARLAREPTLARFRLKPLSAEPKSGDAALEAGHDPAELLVAADPRLPANLMLIDTPDFDSILEDNRLASESLLAVADLVVVVVTRHTYQNREVVRFLDGWLAHGRPWMLVYNEAIDAEVAAAHAAKLMGDVGAAPLAAFWAPHDLEIARGSAALDPRALPFEGAAGIAAAAGGDSLRDVLFRLESLVDIKKRAFAASLAHLRRDVEAVAAAAAAAARTSDDVLAAAAGRTRRSGLQIAAGAMPAAPFIEALRRVLDRRTNPLSRGWRSLLRRARTGLESLPRLLFGAGPRAGGKALQLADVERKQLEQNWPAFWEETVRDLGPEARHSARAALDAGGVGVAGTKGADAEVVQQLDADLAPSRRAECLAGTQRALLDSTPDYDAFRDGCERLIDAAVEERGFDFDIQALADLAMLAPLAMAALFIVKTGGLGSDIAIAGGGAASSFLMEKYSHLLGSSLTAAARERWTEQRGRQIAAILLDAALPRSAPALRQRAAAGRQAAEALRAWYGELS